MCELYGFVCQLGTFYSAGNYCRAAGALELWKFLEPTISHHVRPSDHPGRITYSRNSSYTEAETIVRFVKVLKNTTTVEPLPRDPKILSTSLDTSNRFIPATCYTKTRHTNSEAGTSVPCLPASNRVTIVTGKVWYILFLNKNARTRTNNVQSLRKLYTVCDTVCNIYLTALLCRPIFCSVSCIF